MDEILCPCNAAPPLAQQLADPRVRHGPKENHARPAIDPLFRSAALSEQALWESMRAMRERAMLLRRLGRAPAHNRP